MSKKKTARGPAIAVAGADVGDMVEKEAKRLEVTRRRQARELSQMVSYEITRKEQQVCHKSRSACSKGISQSAAVYVTPLLAIFAAWTSLLHQL